MTAEVQSLYAAVSTNRSIQQGRSEDREGVAQLTHELQKKYVCEACVDMPGGQVGVLYSDCCVGNNTA